MVKDISLLKSLFMGEEESYSIAGVDVKFQKENDDAKFFVVQISKKPSSNTFLNTLSEKIEYVGNAVLSLFSTQRILHVFVHEMRHALTAKFLIKDTSPKITVFFEEEYADAVTECDMVGKSP